MTPPTLARRHNALALFQAFAERSLAAGAAPKGLEQAFAAQLQVSPSMWSQIKSSRPIGDKLARQIEVMVGRPTGWLDQDHAPALPTPAEAEFLGLALAAYRAVSAAGRQGLREQMRELAREASGEASRESSREPPGESSRKD